MFKCFLFIFTYFFIISFSYSLKITEVYFDWTDEYIWIYSQNAFSWNIILSWAKKSNIKTYINIKTNKEIIIWDDGIQNYFSWFKAFKTWLSLSIPDTKSINIDLIYSWWKDNFFVSEDKVKKLNDKKTAFEKVFSWNKETIQAVKTSIHMKKNYIWNPWYVSWVSKNINNNSNNNCSLFTWEILNCFIKLNYKNNNTYNLSFTWNKTFTWIHWFVDNKFYKTWLSLSTSWWYIKAVWNYKEYICTWSFYINKLSQDINQNNWKLIINEIHAWNDNFWEYVELKSIWDVSWNILFKGFTYWDNIFTLPIKSFSWELIVLAKTYSWFVYTWNILKVPQLSLADNWWKLVIQEAGQVLDTAVYEDKNSRYYAYISGGVRYFEKTWPASPWYKTFVTNYYKKHKIYDCNIIFQSFTNGKLNLSSKVLDDKLCNNNYNQIWTYSWWTITWTCNPYPIDIKSQNQQIQFKIFSWEKLLCEDNYNFFYNKKVIKKQRIIQIKSDISSWKNLNCSIKIQWKDNYFFAWEPLNFISVVNNKEIQNSNTNYYCNYFLNNELLSNKCNPSSKNISPWLYNLKLSISSNTWLTCQTVVDLNIPEFSKDYIVNHFTIADFKNLIEKLKSKYVDSSLKTIIEPLSYLYNQENYIANLNSDELNQLVQKITDKYETNYTLKKIFNPIKYLYEKEEINDIENCSKLNSDELNQLVQKIVDKYKTNYTLKNIFNPIKFLYEKENYKFIRDKEIFDFTWNLHIVKILPNPVWKDFWKEVVILSWNFLTWISIWIKEKNYSLSNYSLTWKNYLFTWNFWLTNKSKCINLYYKEKVIDSICYINAKKWQYIKNLIRTKDKVIFKDDYIIVNNQLIENIPFIKLKEKIKDAINIIKKKFKALIDKNKKIKKNKEKTYEQLVKRLIQYNEYKNKYSFIKKELEDKNRKKYHKLIEKDKEIDKLNNINAFLKNFIVYVKKYIPKDIYGQYLDKYKQTKLWKKVRF